MMRSEVASRPLLAVACVVSAMALIGLVDNLVVLIAERGGLMQFHLLRAVLALAILGAVARVWGVSLRPRRAWAAGLRGGCIAVSMLFYFGALAHLSVAEASAGIFTAPVFVMLITFAVLRRAVPMANVAAGLTGFLGALMVLQPELGAFSLPKLMPFGAAIFYAVGAVVTRELCARESALALLSAFFLALVAIGAVGAAALAIWAVPAPAGAEGFLTRAWAPMTWELAALIAVQAVGAVIGVGLLTRAYLLAEAPFVSVFEYVLLIFAAFWAWLLWGDLLDGLAWAGIGLIFASGLFLARQGRAAA